MPTPLEARIKARIRESGPLSVAEYMTLCLLDPIDGYYPTRDPLGLDGDFITAPEISQMFGECLGLWVLQTWNDLGKPDRFNLVELGPGRGVMMADMVRALSLDPECRKAVNITLIEASAALQAVQAKTLGQSNVSVNWASRLEAVSDEPTIIIGNEYLDCLPIRQFVCMETDKGISWSERHVDVKDDGLQFITDGRPAPNNIIDAFPGSHPDPKSGDLLEICPAAAQLVDHLKNRFETAPGRALFLDYGPAQTEFGDTLQAIRKHEKVDVFAAPGQSDLTARVDFAALKALAETADIKTHGPATQADFLAHLGLEQRALMLIKANPDSKAKILRQMHRLTDEKEMGKLFKAICLSSYGLFDPVGFN